MSFELFLSPKVNVTRAPGFGAGRPSEYPWEEAAKHPGEKDDAGEMLYPSFFVPGKTTKNFSGAAQNAGKRHHATFTVRASEEDGVAGVLVQRVEYREPKVRTEAEKAAAKAKREANAAAKAAKAA